MMKFVLAVALLVAASSAQLEEQFAQRQFAPQQFAQQQFAPQQFAQQQFAPQQFAQQQFAPQQFAQQRFAPQQFAQQQFAQQQIAPQQFAQQQIAPQQFIQQRFAQQQEFAPQQFAQQRFAPQQFAQQQFAPQQFAQQQQQFVPQQYARQQQYGNQVPIVRQESQILPDGRFQYAYETGNGIHAEAVGDQKAAGRDGSVQSVQGRFGWTADDGTPVQISYTADENGYQPQGNVLPTPPPVPEAIARSLEYNARNGDRDQE